MFAYYRHSLEIKDIKKIEKNGKNIGLTSKKRKHMGGQKPMILTSNVFPIGFPSFSYCFLFSMFFPMFPILLNHSIVF